MHRTTDRITDVAERIRDRRAAARLENTEHENDVLRTELRALRADASRQRAEREELMDVLKDGGAVRTNGSSRRGGLLRLLIIGGGAYVLGTRAGRERYDQITDWFGRMKTRATEMKRQGDDTVVQVRDSMEATPKAS
jgi:hypothetical protein